MAVLPISVPSIRPRQDNTLNSLLKIGDAFTTHYQTQQSNKLIEQAAGGDENALIKLYGSNPHAAKGIYGMQQDRQQKQERSFMADAIGALSLIAESDDPATAWAEYAPMIKQKYPDQAADIPDQYDEAYMRKAFLELAGMEGNLGKVGQSLGSKYGYLPTDAASVPTSIQEYNLWKTDPQFKEYLAQTGTNEADYAFQTIQGADGTPQVVAINKSDPTKKTIVGTAAGNSIPSGVQEFNTFSKGLTPEQIQEAKEYKLGLRARPSGAAVGIFQQRGADGIDRTFRNSPDGSVEVFDGRQWVPVGQTPQGGQPSMTPTQPDLLNMTLGRSPEVQARLTAENTPPSGFRFNAQGQMEPIPGGPESMAETDRLRARKEAEATGSRIGSGAVPETEKIAAEVREKETERNTVFKLYEAARDGMLTGLEGTYTGPLIGLLPPITAAQQTAQGGVAAMAPVLKQLFRVSGEGVFTDRDQQLLLDMVPDRTDHPTARAAKIANIDTIVRAKLGITPDGGPPQAPTQPGQQGGAKTVTTDQIQRLSSQARISPEEARQKLLDAGYMIR